MGTTLADFVDEKHGGTHPLCRHPWLYKDGANGWKSVATDGKTLVFAPDEIGLPELDAHGVKMIALYAERPKPPIEFTVDRAAFSDWLGPCEPPERRCDSCGGARRRGHAYSGWPCLNRLGEKHERLRHEERELRCKCKHDPGCQTCDRGWNVCVSCDGTGVFCDYKAVAITLDGVIFAGDRVRKILELPYFAQVIQFSWSLGTAQEPGLLEAGGCRVWLMPCTGPQPERAVPASCLSRLAVYGKTRPIRT